MLWQSLGAGTGTNECCRRVGIHQTAQFQSVNWSVQLLHHTASLNTVRIRPKTYVTNTHSKKARKFSRQSMFVQFSCVSFPCPVLSPPQIQLGCPGEHCDLPGESNKRFLKWKNEKWFIAYSSSMLDYTWNIKTLKQQNTVQSALWVPLIAELHKFSDGEIAKFCKTEWCRGRHLSYMYLLRLHALWSVLALRFTHGVSQKYGFKLVKEVSMWHTIPCRPTSSHALIASELRERCGQQTSADLRAKFCGHCPSGTPPSGALNARGVAKYSDFEPVEGYCVINDPRYGIGYN